MRETRNARVRQQGPRPRSRFLLIAIAHFQSSGVQDRWIDAAAERPEWRANCSGQSLPPNSEALAGMSLVHLRHLRQISRTSHVPTGWMTLASRCSSASLLLSQLAHCEQQQSQTHTPTHVNVNVSAQHGALIPPDLHDM